MSEHPILFSDEMVRAILDGRKTQTRRPVKPPMGEGSPPECHWLDCGVEPDTQRYGIRGPLGIHVSPLGGPGDDLWVRECWGSTNDYDGQYLLEGRKALYRADEEQSITPSKWRPSIHMPRWASRIILPVTGVRVERVRDISEEDARDEGVDTHAYSWPEGTTPNHARDCGGLYRNGFRNLWDSIYADKGFGWNENPWVWVGEFEKVNK